MTAPYRTRIMLIDPQGRETELVRLQRALHECDRKFWLRGISDSWRVVVQTAGRISRELAHHG